MELHLTLNGERRTCVVDPDEKLLHTLRNLGLTSVKKGCGEGSCGTCVVILNGKLVNSCVVFTASCDGSEITTVEGLGDPLRPHLLQTEFVQAGAVQCGFCTPGMILAAKVLLDHNPTPTREQILQALDGNRCRCTGYVKILDAVQNAAQALEPKG